MKNYSWEGEIVLARSVGAEVWEDVARDVQASAFAFAGVGDVVGLIFGEFT
jgi:hypothetical protein